MILDQNHNVIIEIIILKLTKINRLAFYQEF